MYTMAATAAAVLFVLIFHDILVRSEKYYLLCAIRNPVVAVRTCLLHVCMYKIPRVYTRNTTHEPDLTPKVNIREIWSRRHVLRDIYIHLLKDQNNPVKAILDTIYILYSIFKSNALIFIVLINFRMI